MKKVVPFHILLLVSTIVIHVSIQNPTYEALRIMGTIGLVQFFYGIYSWTKLGNQLISPYFFFFLCLYMFSLGQSLLYPFNIVGEYDLLNRGESEGAIFEAQYYTLLFLNCFHLGALTANNSQDVKIQDCRGYTFPYLRYVAWGLFLISFYPYVHGKIETLSFAMAYGYDALYDRELSYGIENTGSMIASYFIPSTLCLYVTYSKKKIARISIFGLWILLIGIMLAIGGRTRAVILMSIMVVLYNYYVKKLSRKQIILLAAGGLVVLSLLSIVAQTRNQTNKSIKISAKELLSNNGAVNAASEMGSTMFCLIHSMDYVPSDENYRLGKSYLYSLTTIIPNLGFWKEHPAKREANLGNWLTEKMGLEYGTGFSMVAEAYVNFGPFGIFAMFLLGFLFSSMLGMLDDAFYKENTPVIIFCIIMFWMSLRLPRNSFIGLVRAVVFNAGLIYYIVKQKKIKTQ